MDEMKKLIEEAEKSVAKEVATKTYGKNDAVPPQNVVVKSKTIPIVLSILIVGAAIVAAIILTRPDNKVPDVNQKPQVASSEEKRIINKDNLPTPSAEERSRYIKEARAAFSEIDKLQASTEVGILYVDYIKRVGELNYALKTFLDNNRAFYEKYRGSSYVVIARNLMYQKNCAELWGLSINMFGDADISPIIKPFLGKVWNYLAAQTTLGKAIFDETSIEKRREIVEKLNRNEQIIQAEHQATIKSLEDRAAQIKRLQEFQTKLATDVEQKSRQGLEQLEAVLKKYSLDQ